MTDQHSAAARPPSAGEARAAHAHREGSIRLGPLLAFVAVWLGGSWLVVGAVLHPLVPGGWFTVLAAITLCAFAAIRLVRAFTRGGYPSALTRLFVFRPFWYLMLFMPLLAGAGLVGALGGLPFGASRAVGSWAIGVVAVLLAIAAAIGYIGTRQLVVRQLEVRMPHLPAAFDGLRLVQISDLHVGPHTPRRFLARIVDAVRHAQPDIVVHTGDQVDDFPRDVDRFGAAFSELTAPLGVFAIAGNHDVFAGWDGVRQGLEGAGITVLVNAAVPLDRGGARIWLAGTGDPTGRSWPRGGGLHAAPDIHGTLSRVPPGDPVIVLAHNPALWPELAQRGVDLTLSGHTHYGQLAIPVWGWNAAALFVSPSMGTHRNGDALLYINPGTNYWGIPFRIGTPPEVTVLVLRRSARGQGPSIEALHPQRGTAR